MLEADVVRTAQGLLCLEVRLCHEADSYRDKAGRELTPALSPARFGSTPLFLFRPN